MTEVSRRALFKATGAIGGDAAETADARSPSAVTPTAMPSIRAAAAPAITYVFFNSEEAAFIESAVAAADFGTTAERAED